MTAGRLRALALLAPLLLAAASATLTPQQQRGRRIYRSGESDSGKPIAASLGEDSADVPAGVVPCANCHGYDGRGKPEGGVKPSDITAEALARASAGDDARKHPAYTRALLKRAVTMGIDSGRNQLDAAMPRYRLTLQDAEDLVAYLSILGHEPQAGISDKSITFGVIVPVGDSAIRDALREAVAPANRNGIYGRTIELRFASDADALLRDDTVFAILDATAGSRTASIADERHVPAIVLDAPAELSSRYAFSIAGGIREEAQALLAYARHHGAKKIAVAGDDASLIEGDDVHADSKDADAVIVLGDRARATEVLTQAAARETPPLVLMLSTSAPAELPALDHRVIVAFALPPSANAPRDAVLAALTVSLGALTKLGRDVTPEAFTESLEHTYHYESRGIPPITWRQNRRTGLAAAYLMTLDVKAGGFVGEPGWVGE